MSEFEKKKRDVQARITKLLDHYLPHNQQRLHQAMRYACLNGGKRIRAFLVYATADAYQTPWETVDRLAIAIECIHAYSLVHDDLPAMDDDDLRRGKPTCHKAFDEATAILVGDALLTFAFELLSDTEHWPIKKSKQLTIISLLAKAIGQHGMVLGQAWDMENTKKVISGETLINLHRAKTGALINACVQCSAIACGETNRQKLDALEGFGQSIGLAYQIQDDLLDVTGKTVMLGKQQGKDQQAEKNTFISLFGIETSKQKADDCLTQALNYLQQLNKPAQMLNDIAQFCIARGF